MFSPHQSVKESNYINGMLMMMTMTTMILSSAVHHIIEMVVMVKDRTMVMALVYVVSVST